MIDRMNLLAHFKQYASCSDEYVADMARIKREIVQHVLEEMNFSLKKDKVRIAVLGASDKRYIKVHQGIFEAVFPGSKVEVNTFDIDTEHLGGELGIVEHDLNEPFPNPPYDVIFSHELMKFLTSESQIRVIENAYRALSTTGIGFHIVHEPAIKGTDRLMHWQFRVAPDSLVTQLRETGISVQKLEFMTKTVLAHMQETTVLVIKSGQ
jgi:hypothetical protein